MDEDESPANGREARQFCKNACRNGGGLPAGKTACPGQATDPSEDQTSILVRMRSTTASLNSVVPA